MTMCPITTTSKPLTYKRTLSKSGINKLAYRHASCFRALRNPSCLGFAATHGPRLALLPVVRRSLIRPMATFVPPIVRIFRPSPEGLNGRRLATDSERITDRLLIDNHTKWGFVIYRCTYADDEAWARFISVFKERAYDRLNGEEGGPELAEKLVWTIHEDRSSLDGASVEQIRERFKGWITSDEAQAEQRGMTCSGTRFNYAIFVDAAALDSCKVLMRQGPVEAIDVSTYPYVNIVSASWEPYPVDDKYSEDPDDETLDVGWMMVSVDALIPSYYENFNDGYFTLYIRPPGLAWK